MEKDLHFLIHNMMTIFIHLLKHSGGQSCVVKSKKKKKKVTVTLPRVRKMLHTSWLVFYYNKKY